MANLRFSNLIIGMILCSLFVVVMTLYLGEFNTRYPLNNNSKISELNSTYNQLTRIHQNASEIKNVTEGITTDASWTDIFGGFFRGGWTALKTTAQSYDIMFDTADDLVEESYLGASTKYFRTALISILTIAIFVGIFLSVALRREL